MQMYSREEQKKKQNSYVWALERKVTFKKETRRGFCTLLPGWSLMEPRSCWGCNRSRQSSGNERATNPLLCDMEGQRNKNDYKESFLRWDCCQWCQNTKSSLHFCLYIYNVFYSETVIILHAQKKQKKTNTLDVGWLVLC